MSGEFNVPGGDIILRTSGSPNRNFRVHKLVFSLASPVFTDMFGLPQPLEFTLGSGERDDAGRNLKFDV